MHEDIVAAGTLVEVAGSGAAVDAYGIERLIIDGDARAYAGTWTAVVRRA